MPERPLTPAMLATLRAIERGEVRISNPGGAPRIRGASPTVVGRAIRTLGLARWPRHGLMEGEVAELTDTGRRAIGA